MANLRIECDDPELQQDVDEMILDYLLHGAIIAVLNEFTDPSIGDSSYATADLHLQMVESFLQLFQVNHAGKQISSNLKTRMKVLGFASLFARHLARSSTTPHCVSLEQLRSQNAKRALDLLGNLVEKDFDGLASYFSLARSASSNAQLQQRLARNRQTTLLSCNLLPSGDYYGSTESLSLLDLLPDFMNLLAEAWSALPFNPFKTIMEYKFQAVLEQSRIFGNSGLDVIREVLIWGPAMNPGGNEDEAPGADVVKEIFTKFSKAEQLAWESADIKQLNKLKPEDGTDMLDHLDQLAEQFPLPAFHAMMIETLMALVSIPEKPVLMQLEEGRLKGLSVEDTTALMARCGL